jgi:hypothetical protein
MKEMPQVCSCFHHYLNSHHMSIANSQISMLYCYGEVSYKVSQALLPFSDLLCDAICVLTIPDSPTRPLWQIPAETSSSESG